MSRNKISENVQQQVRSRADYLCEFCHANERWQYVKFTVDHVLPVSLGGGNNLDNLTLACFHCIRSIDYLTSIKMSKPSPRRANPAKMEIATPIAKDRA